MSEYDRTGAAFYDHWSLGLEGDVEFYVDAARRAGGPVLEIGCGTGRILLPMAQAGVPVVGVDRAPAMLDVLRRKLARLGPDARARVELVEADVRTLALGRRFPLVAIPYRAFLHLLTVTEQLQALARIHEHLTDDGRLILNVFDPDPHIVAARLGPQGRAPIKDGEFIHPDTGHQVIVWFGCRYDPERQVMDGHFIFEELDGAGRMILRTYTPLTLRHVYRYEMEHLLERSGFAVDALYGDFHRGPFRTGGEQVWVARPR